MEEKHIPGADNVAPEAEAPAPTPEPEDDKAPEETTPEGDKPQSDEEKPPEAEKPKDEAKPEPEPKLPKPRSIYDDLKDERGKRKTAEQRAKELEEENIRLKGDTPPEKPAEPSKPEKPTDELEAYAQENGLDAKELGRLAEILAKRVPTAQLSEEDKLALADVKTWRATQQRSTEDQEVLATAPSVQEQLGITDTKELKTVMDEVVRLSHTAAFHDKEVDYIIWKNRDTLSKLVSPKKPSFEQGGQHVDAQPEAETDFSATKGITPEMAGKASTASKTPTLEVRRGNQTL